MEHETGPEFYAREAGLLRAQVERLESVRKQCITAACREEHGREIQRLTDKAAAAARAWHKAGGRLHQVPRAPQR